jgi:hypothetical protein
MTAQPAEPPITLDRLAAAIRDLPVVRPVSLNVGSAILAWLRRMPAAPRPHELSLFLGTPVVLDDRLDTGQWQFRDGTGKVVTEGRVGKPGETVIYLEGPDAFVAYDPAKVETDLRAAMQRMTADLSKRHEVDPAKMTGIRPVAVHIAPPAPGRPVPPAAS